MFEQMVPSWWYHFEKFWHLYGVEFHREKWSTGGGGVSLEVL